MGYIAFDCAAEILSDAGVTLHAAGLQYVGTLIWIAAASVLFTVVTWYRDDEVVRAAFLLGTIMGVAYPFAVAAGVLFLSDNRSWGAVLAVGSLLFIPLRVLVLSVVFGALVSIGRRFRHLFAPSTL